MPAEVIEMPGEESDSAIVSLGGVRKEVSLALVDDVRVGDYVIAHVGYAIEKLDTAEAKKTLVLMALTADSALADVLPSEAYAGHFPLGI